MRNIPHILSDLNIPLTPHPLVGGTVWGDHRTFRRQSLAGGSTPLGWALEFRYRWLLSDALFCVCSSNVLGQLFAPCLTHHCGLQNHKPKETLSSTGYVWSVFIIATERNGRTWSDRCPFYPSIFP